jgi:hypothetical protein
LVLPDLAPRAEAVALKGTQHVLSSALASHALLLALARAPAGIAARVRSCSGPGAGAFLSAPTGSSRLSPAQFRGALARRLGLPQTRILAAALCPYCPHDHEEGTEVDVVGIHASCCRGSRKAQVRRHNLVRDLVASWCRRAGLTTSVETSVGGLPGDVVTAGGWGECRSKTLVIDTTVNNALARHP